MQANLAIGNGAGIPCYVPRSGVDGLCLVFICFRNFRTEFHSGHISWCPTVHKGSVFSVSLPFSFVFLVMVTVDQVRQKYNVILLPY